MEQIYIKFKNNIPTWELLKNLGVQQAFPKIIIIMEVFSANEMIYSVQYKIEGHYYCCGSQNFEFEENDIEKTVLKDCDGSIKNLIIEEIQKQSKCIKDNFNDTILNIWKTKILNILCDLSS
jgi:hypothetical protein